MVKKITYLIAISLILISCNNSLTVLNRKYRSGYSFSLLPKALDVKTNTYRNIEEYRNEIKTDSIIREREENAYTCSNSTEPLIINYKPTPITFVCDTPPKKNADKPWALYKPQPLDKETTSGRKLEPYQFASVLCIVVIGSISAILKSPLIAIIFPIIFVLSIISLIRIHHYPNKYLRYSKVSSIFHLIIGGIFTLAFLIVGVVILLDL